MIEERRSRLTPGTRAIVGLVAGLAAGAAIAAAAAPSLAQIAAGAELVGTLWINAILMTILPLVVSKLVVSIASQSDSHAIGRVGWRAVALFATLLAAGALLTTAIVPVLFAHIPIDAATSTSLRTAAHGLASAESPPSAAQFLQSLVPSNAIRAAADGTILPLLVFTLAFAFSARNISPSLRDPLVTLFRAVDAAISVLLQWVVALAPYGVFALGLALASRVGGAVVAALAFYIVMSSVTLVLFTALLYPLVRLLAGVPLGLFLRACAPAQVVAFGTHSSMASLPAMLDGAGSRLTLSEKSTGFVLPLSLAVFKFSGPIWFITATHFVARLYDVSFDPSRALSVAVVAVITSLAIGGVPSGAAVVIAPVLAAAGLPVEAMGTLLALDPIPNAFRTVANVTGMMAVTTIVDSQAPEPDHGSTP